MPGHEDKFADENCFIITMPSRGKLHLYGNDPEELKIRDMANATSKQCRFTGHMLEDAWYSVAEHMVDVSTIIEHLGGSPLDQFCGLIHDTPEYGLSDIAAPFKREIGLYYEKEALIWNRIADKLKIPKKLPEIVKRADWVALFIEASVFVIPEHQYLLKNWIGYDPYGYQARMMKPELVPERWQFWRERKIMHGYHHQQARMLWLARYNKLKNLMGRHDLPSVA